MTPTQERNGPSNNSRGTTEVTLGVNVRYDLEIIRHSSSHIGYVTQTISTQILRHSPPFFARRVGWRLLWLIRDTGR